MQKNTRLLMALSLVSVACNTLTNITTTDESTGVTASFFGKLRPEFFIGRNVNLLNNENKNDFIAYARSVFDIGFNVAYNSTVEMNIVGRNKAVWGNPASIIPTTVIEPKIVDSVLAPHSHAIPRHLVWLREAWLRFDLGKLFGCPFETSHSFTIGAFPFSLGVYSIALGDAYAVGPDALGFYSDSSIDQFAYGMLLSGGLVPDVLSYSFYGALLENKTGSLSQTGAKVRAQQYGRQYNPARGPGIINYLVAGSLSWYPIKDEKIGSVEVQPYFLFNHDKEQRIEFAADASSKLATIGLGIEYLGDVVEFGIETAFNAGHQDVRGWDRNKVDLKNVGGYVSQVNSKVSDANGKAIPFISGSPSQNAIFNTTQSESENGKQIPGTFDTIGYLEPKDGQIFNASNRFRDPYRNVYKGWMIMSDASFYVYKKDVKIGIAAGAASGDTNPNFVQKDGDFQGFIGLQELFSGKRVMSAFFLGGAGKVSRPIADPTVNERSNALSKTVGGFTNIILFGTGLTWSPRDWDVPLSINPNVMAFWQETSVPKVVLQEPTDCVANLPQADKYLGTEFNIFINYNPIKNLKLFSVFSLFKPGQFYTDIKGRRAAQDLLDKLDREDLIGFTKDTIPTYGDDVAITFNMGLEYRF